MNKLVVIVEGQTEQTFVRDQLAAHLALYNTNAWPILPGRNGNRGGVKKWKAARPDIIRALQEGSYCSTMFDYYGMPDDWPGRTDANTQPWHTRARLVEQRIHQDITAAMGSRFNPKYFVPYVQLHEFEALAFADIAILASVLFPMGGHPYEFLAAHFRSILTTAGHAEAINDGYETCPSRQISGFVPAYKKRLHGPMVTNRIGIPVLRVQCPHFGEWLTRLEQLAGEEI
ncbi:MAG: DUF4276 family protein [Planctomycetota bacterium]|nr:DUF4276 family protein [Planctomycetota bacterium]